MKDTLLTIEPSSVSTRLTHFVHSVLSEVGLTDVVVAVSGGIDSAVSVSLAVKSLGCEHVFPLLLPYGEMSEQSTKDALLVLSSLHIPEQNIQQINIKPIVDLITGLDEKCDRIRKGNIMARVRMIVVFDTAKKRNALVVGTENKSEHYLGYFTRFGDEASDIEPLRSLYKTQVFQLAEFLDIPKEILNKAPSAGLWEGQTDEGEFGFRYRDADMVLTLLIDKKMTKKGVVNTFGNELIVEKIIQRVKESGYKHKVPYVQR